MITRVFVDSPNIEAIGYDDATQDLRVEFLSGGHLVYQQVPREIFDEFQAAPSKGSFLNRRLRNTYRFTRHLKPDGLYVVFDGPPSHESGRFVEVEDENGRGVKSGCTWRQRPDGLWDLGPFQKTIPEVLTDAVEPDSPPGPQES